MVELWWWADDVGQGSVVTGNLEFVGEVWLYVGLSMLTELAGLSKRANVLDVPIELDDLDVPELSELSIVTAEVGVMESFPTF